MKLFLVIRRSDLGLHAVLTFPDEANKYAESELAAYCDAGFEGRIFLAQDLAEVVSSYPSWFTEDGAEDL